MAKVNVRSLRSRRRELTGKVREAIGFVRSENVKARKQGWMPNLTGMNEALGAAIGWTRELAKVEGQIKRAGARINPQAPRLRKYAQRTDKAIDGAINRAVGVRMKMPREQSMSMSHKEHIELGGNSAYSEKLVADRRALHSHYELTGREHTPMTQQEMDRFHANIMRGDFSRSGIQVLRPKGKASKSIH